MTENEEIAPQRSLLAQIFISPDEPRLRAGWRLLIYTVGWLILTTIIGGIPIFIWITTQIAANPGLDPVALTEQLTASLQYVGNPMLMLVTILSALTTFVTTWLARRFLDRRSSTSLGFQPKRSVSDLLFGIGLGGLLMVLIYGFEEVMGWLHFEEFAWQSEAAGSMVVGLLAALTTYIGVGYQEEVVSRGYHLQNLWAGLNLPLALLISSGVFALAHMNNQNASWVSTLGIFFAGLFLAYGYLRTSELWIPIGVHIGWNFFQGTIFGFPVSGTDGFHLIRQTVEGPDIITGGAFGPEAGMISWVAMLLGAALIWVYTRGRTSASRDASKPTAALAPDSSNV
jgi:uncharacterized protein